MASSLGRLALGFVGALLAPVGFAAIGFAIGSAIGGFLFAPEGPTVEGPRLGDTDVTSSSLGKVIPFHYGVTRSAGNVIWSAGLKETKREEKQGGGKGGGGGGATQVSYEYSASFAAAFGRGPAKDVLRMWADGKLIYDATGKEASGATSAPTFNFRFIKGGEGTPIDPLIAESVNRRLAGLPDVNEGNGPQSSYRTINDLISEVNSGSNPRSSIYSNYLTQLKIDAEASGAGVPDYRFTPAYKELCYIVFDDMPLADFGNRIPNITAEIVWTSDDDVKDQDTVVVSDVPETSTDRTAPTGLMGVDRFSQSTLVISGTKLRRFSASSSAETFSRDATQVVSDGSNSVSAVAVKVLGATADGDFLTVLQRSGLTNTPILGKVSSSSLEIIGAGRPGNPGGFLPPEMPASAASMKYAASAGKNGGRSLMLGNDADGRVYALDTSGDHVRLAGTKITPVPDFHSLSGPDGTYVSPSHFSGQGRGPMVPGGGSEGDSVVYFVSFNYSGWHLYKIRVRFPADVNVAPTLSPEVIAQGPNSEVPKSIIYDESTDNVIVLFEVGSHGRIMVFSPNDPSPLQYSKDLTYAPPSENSGLSRSSPTSSHLAYARGTNAILVNTLTGEEKVYPNVLPAVASNDSQVYIGYTSSLYTWMGSKPKVIRFSRLSADLYATDLAYIISDICTRTGMSQDEFDVEPIRGKHKVSGYTVARNSNARKALEPLMLAYFVDGIETDWNVRFQERTTEPKRVLKENELGSVKAPSGDVAIAESRQPEYDLPSQIAMVYMDKDRDYQQGSAHYRRVSEPAPSMYSKKVHNIELPLVMTETEARSIAQRAMFTTWMARDTSKIQLPWTHADLDPSDVVSIEFNDGRKLTNHVGKIVMGANFELELNTARSGDPVFTASDMAEVTTSTVPSLSIPTPAYSKMFVFDIPLLFDYHDTARSGSRYYMAVGSDTPLFISADVYSSLDGNSYLATDTAPVDITWGQVVGTPLASPRSLFTVDTDNSITVALGVNNGDIHTITDDQLLAGQNMALIWNQSTGNAEIIQFRDATDNGDGTVTLSTFVRGRRGTDWLVDSHTTGEYFILLSEQAILSRTQSLSILGNTQYFKSVSRGSLVGNALATSVKFEGNDLKPYAPSNVTRTDDGTNLTLTWNRRTRIGGEWNHTTNVEDVPLGEDTERYRVFLVNNAASALESFDPDNSGSYLRSFDTNVPSLTISGTSLASYGYTLNDDINCVVYQVSTQVGLGFPRKATLPR